jgi:hypothetical protein
VPTNGFVAGRVIRTREPGAKSIAGRVVLCATASWATQPASTIAMAEQLRSRARPRARISAA